MKVLIADDDPVCRRALKGILERHGHECIEAADGGEAWEVFQQQSPDVIVSDRTMPRLDGLELCRRVRTSEGRYSYFIIVTSKDDHEARLEGMCAGADDYLLKPLDRVELQLRLIAAQRVCTLHERLQSQQRDLESLNRTLWEQGRTDALTGLRNRLSMQEDHRKIHARLRRHRHPYGLCIVDVDHFKQYNDTLGHPAGDEALRLIGWTLGGALRATDTIYRFGGEEFVILMPDNSRDGCAVIVETLRNTVEKMALHHPGSERGVVTVSLGLAWISPEDGCSQEEALARADKALYLAKNSGRNTFRLHEPACDAVDFVSK